MNDFKNEIEEYLSNWGVLEATDQRIDLFVQRYPEWKARIPEKDVPVILELLRIFRYYSHAKVNEILKELHQRLISENTIRDDDTIFTFLPSKNGKYGSSIDYLHDYRCINNIQKYRCSFEIELLQSDRWDSLRNVIIIDDCCGTGMKLSDYLTENHDLLSGKNIYVLIIECMESAFDRIKKLGKEIELNIILLAGIVSEKAFSKSFWGAETETAIQSLVSFSESVGIDRDIKGFGDAEGLMAFHDDTPNDTLKIFWFDGANYLSLFPREKIPAFARPSRPKPDDLANELTHRKRTNYKLLRRENNSG